MTLHRATAIILLALAAPLGLGAQEHRRDTVVVVHRDTVWYVPRRLERRMRSSGYFPHEAALRRSVAALRTNLAAPLLNAGAEFPLSDRWALGLDVYWPWVSRTLMDRRFEDHRHCFQALGGFLEGRYYLGSMHAPGKERYRLLGHSLAVVMGGAYYDVQRDWTGQQGELLAVGLGYQYAMPLGRRCPVHLEFDLVLGGVFHVSHPYAVHEEGGYLIRGTDQYGEPVRRITGWLVGIPMRAGVNLVVPFRTDLPTRRREGARR